MFPNLSDKAETPHGQVMIDTMPDIVHVVRYRCSTAVADDSHRMQATGLRHTAGYWGRVLARCNRKRVLAMILAVRTCRVFRWTVPVIIGRPTV